MMNYAVAKGFVNAESGTFLFDQYRESRDATRAAAAATAPAAGADVDREVAQQKTQIGLAMTSAGISVVAQIVAMVMGGVGGGGGGGGANTGGTAGASPGASPAEAAASPAGTTPPVAQGSVSAEAPTQDSSAMDFLLDQLGILGDLIQGKPFDWQGASGMPGQVRDLMNQASGQRGPESQEERVEKLVQATGRALSSVVDLAREGAQSEGDRWRGASERARSQEAGARSETEAVLNDREEIMRLMLEAKRA